MLTSYLTLVLRQFKRNGSLTALNVVGLTLGLTCALLILFYVRFELSYDRFHPAAERTFRVYQDLRGDRAGEDPWSFTGAPVAGVLREEVAEVEEATRLHPKATLVASPERQVQFREADLVYADPSVFSLFGFPLQSGNAAQALAQPGSIVLSPELAVKYFGQEDVVGRQLRLDDQVDVTVTGVLAPLPANTHLRFSALAPFDLLHQLYGAPTFDSWWWPAVQTYVRLAPGASAEGLNAQALPALVQRHREPGIARSIVPQLQAVEHIRLFGKPGTGTLTRVFVFGSIALFVLLIACINFTNIATAQAADRAKEVAMRNVFGSERWQLIVQFLSESLLLSLVATALAIGLTALLTPTFGVLVGQPLMMPWSEGWFWSTALGLGLVTGLLAGAYPAFFLSGLGALGVLKGSSSTTTSSALGARLRKTLVTAQFAISAALIVCALVIFSQLDYLENKELGFDPEGVVVLPTSTDARVLRGYDAFRQEALRSPSVRAVSAASSLPGVDGGMEVPGRIEGAAQAEGDEKMSVVYASFGYTDVLGLDVGAGRSFGEAYKADKERAFLLNRAAATTYALSEPLDRAVRLSYSDGGRELYRKEGQVVGVLDDFHASSLYDPVEPLVITMAGPGDLHRLDYFLVALAPDQTGEGMTQLKTLWERSFPHRPFEATLLADRMGSLYQDEALFGRLLGGFALLAVGIACLGLLGMVAFTARRRTREIALRKVLGASNWDVARLLTVDFLRLVAIGFVLAIPAAYYAMHAWLGHFAYHVGLGPSVFVLAGLITLTIALATVSYQTLRATRIAPARAMRCE